MTEAAQPEPQSISLRVRFLSGGAGLTLSDGVTALMFAVAAVVSFLWRATPAADPLLHLHEQLGLGLMIDGGFVLLSATLVDIATRVKARPPLWAVVLIAGTVFMFYGGFAVLQKAWALGGAVLVPVVSSLVDRAAVLWHLPRKTRIEKIGARALVSNRINALLVAGFLFVAMIIGGMVWPGADDLVTGPWLYLAAGALYFAIAAYDSVRVRGSRFAARPTVLFGFDPIRIEYLEPV